MIGDFVKINPNKKIDEQQSVKKKNKKQNVKSSSSVSKRRMVNVPTNNKPKLVDNQVMRSHNFISTTKPTLTEIRPLIHESGRKYSFDQKPTKVSAMLKLILTTIETPDLSDTW